MKNLVLRNRIKATILAGIVFAGGAVTLTGCDKEESSYTQGAYSSFDDLLNSLPDGIKKENLQTIYNVLYHLNGEVANSVKEDGDGEKLFQMCWDTIQALDLASNDYTSQEMLDMFDTFEYDADYLYELYQNFSSIFIPFGERLLMPTGLHNLINDEEQKGDFLKYENILIEINAARIGNDSNKLDELYKTAFAYIRSDFLSASGDTAFTNAVASQDKSTGYYSLVIPYVNTIMELGRNSTYKLTDSEVEKLNNVGICNMALASIEDNIEGHKIKIASVNVNELPSIGVYEEARAFAIESLQKEGLYFVSYENSNLLKTEEELLYNSIEVTNDYSIKAPKTTTTKKETTTRTYSSLEELKENENADVIKKAEEGKQKVDQQIEKENQNNKAEAREEASEKASQESAENKAESDEKMEEIKDNAVVVDPNGNVDTDKEIVQPESPDEVISGVEEDREFDGPAYDADGNIIVQDSKQKSITTTVNANVKLLVKSI